MLNNIIEFLGRTHFVVLHFPIALITTAAIVEAVALLRLRFLRHTSTTDYRPSNTAAIMFGFAFASTIVAVTTGLILGFDETTAVDLHRILGIVSGILILITSIALLIALKKATHKSAFIYLALLIASAGAVSFTGHLGGNLTHGEGFLTQPLKQIFSSTPPTESPEIEDLNITPAALEIYNSTIQPIFENSCIKCHGDKKQKGDIRLDTLAYVLDKDFATLERGEPDASEIIYRVELPSEDEDAMPPLRKAHPLTTNEIDRLRNWISSLTP